MSTYNGEMYLESQIESILSQKTTFEFDLIVRDDGSTDSTISILDRYAQMQKLKYIKGRNIGAARGFIQLIQDNRDFDYYAFSDQDDVWDEDKLETGVQALHDRKGPALYCSNCELVNANLESIGRNTHRCEPTYTLESILCLASCAQGCTSILNSSLAHIIQDNPQPSVFIMHDSLITCLCGMINGQIVYNHKPTMKYRMHDKNVFGMVSAKQNKLNVIRQRFKEITSKKKISMYDQTASLVETYGEYIPEENMQICTYIINSKHSLRARLYLVFNKRVKHDTLNKTITKKLEILFGND